MVSRRAFLGVSMAAACSRRGTAGYRGYAFVANQEGRAVAAVDLQALVVVRHIAIDGAPAQVLAARTRPAVYALAPEEGFVFEIQSDRLSVRRKLNVGRAVAMSLDTKERGLYVLAQDGLVRIALESFAVDWRIPLNAPVEFAIAADGKIGAVSDGRSVRLIDVASRKVGDPIAESEFGTVCFLSDSKTLIAADRGSRRLSLFDCGSAKLITHLPLAVRPDNLCFNSDGGQLYVTGDGLDAVVIVYPYHTPEVGQTVLAGHAPGPMAASAQYLFVASPEAGNVSVMSVVSQKVIAVVAVGSDPGCIVVTPDDQFALVLNRRSGDMAVLGNRTNPAAMRTMIPVGSRPVSAAVQSL